MLNPLACWTWSFFNTFFSPSARTTTCVTTMIWWESISYLDTLYYQHFQLFWFHHHVMVTSSPCPPQWPQWSPRHSRPPSKGTSSFSWGRTAWQGPETSAWFKRTCNLLLLQQQEHERQMQHLLLLLVGDEEILGGVGVWLPSAPPLYMAGHLAGLQRSLESWGANHLTCSSQNDAKGVIILRKWKIEYGWCWQ